MERKNEMEKGGSFRQDSPRTHRAKVSPGTLLMGKMEQNGDRRRWTARLRRPSISLSLQQSLFPGCPRCQGWCEWEEERSGRRDSPARYTLEC